MNQGSKVKLIFMDLHLESSNDCQYDYVRIYDGPDRQRSKILNNYCTQPEEPIESSGNSMVVVFRTDFSQGGRGFHARYLMDCNT